MPFTSLVISVRLPHAPCFILCGLFSVLMSLQIKVIYATRCCVAHCLYTLQCVCLSHSKHKVNGKWMNNEPGSWIFFFFGWTFPLSVVAYYYFSSLAIVSMHHMYELVYERCNQMMICRRRHAKQRQNKHKYWEWVWRWRDIMTFGSVTRALLRYLCVPPLLGCLILSFIFSFSFVLFCNTEHRTENREGERESERNKTEKNKKNWIHF